MTRSATTLAALLGLVLLAPLADSSCSFHGHTHDDDDDWRWHSKSTATVTGASLQVTRNVSPLAPRAVRDQG